MRKWLFLACITLSLHARRTAIEKLIEPPKVNEVQAPWLTGPLLAPSGITIPPGHYNIEPYIYATAITAKYDRDWKEVKTETFWNNSFQPALQFGLTDWLDFEIFPTLFYNYTKKAGKWVAADMPMNFDIQLYTHGKRVIDWITSLKLVIKETVPIGKYRNLNPRKLATDVGGQGSWQSALGLVWGNCFYLGKDRFLTARVNLQYTLPAPVHVKNLNVYGGGPGTNGTVYPAQNFFFDIGTELTLTKNWAFAMDIVGSWYGKARFKGKTILPNKLPPATQFSLAPAIEYNWNGSLGIIFGPWFTVAGRNSVKFTSGVFAVNYYH